MSTLAGGFSNSNGNGGGVGVGGDVRDDLTQALIDRREWSDGDAAGSGMPIVDVPLVSVGGGLGSFALVDLLRIAGVGQDSIRVLTEASSPIETYSTLARFSQIPDHERLRSDAGSVMDNIWGFPSYAMREAAAAKGFGARVRPLAKVLTEPILSEYYTPRAGQVYASVEREAARIGWDDMGAVGQARMVRRRLGGGYFVVLTLPPGARRSGKRVLYRTDFVHLAVGYPGVRMLADLRAYRTEHNDFVRVVNAYTQHEHVYRNTALRPCTVVVRGSGIVASRVLQRLLDDRELHGTQTRVTHLFRTYVRGSQTFGGRGRRMRRPGRDGFAYQAFNYPKSAWGGQLQASFEAAPPDERPAILGQLGGTQTAPRADWMRQLERARAGGFYDQVIGTLDAIEPAADDRIRTVVRTAEGPLEVHADYIIDATGLEASVEDHRLLADLLAKTGAETNPFGRIAVDETFGVIGTASTPGRLYASGSMTLGGPYAPVDSFLGLQFAAHRIVDDLAARGFCRRIGIGRSISQWSRWMRNVAP